MIFITDMLLTVNGGHLSEVEEPLALVVAVLRLVRPQDVHGRLGDSVRPGVRYRVLVAHLKDSRDEAQASASMAGVFERDA